MAQQHRQQQQQPSGSAAIELFRDATVRDEARAGVSAAKRRYKYEAKPDLPPGIQTLFGANPKHWNVYTKEKGATLMTALTGLGTIIAKDKAVDKWQCARPLSAAARLLRNVPLGHRVVGAEPKASEEPTNLRDAYAPMFAHRPDEWKQIPYGGETYTDEAFADQQLNGCQPYFIRRVDGDIAALQEKIRVTDADVASVTGSKTTLADLIKDDRLFIIDTSPYFEGLWGNPALQGVCNAVPVALFYIDTAKGRLMPLAIQLFPGEGRAGYANPVFTKNDDANVWLAAKLFVNNALVCVHTAGQHFLYMKVHLATALAVQRCLPARHPIADLAYGFSDFAIANASAAPMAPPAEPWKQKLIKRHWYIYDQETLHVRDDVKGRGVEDIPHYHWRDESLALFEVFERFVERVVDDAYATDADVARDAFLSDLAEELHEEVNLRGTVINRTASGRFETKAKVVRFFAEFCYYSSARYCYDVLQWPWYVWVPATPVSFNLTPMTTKDSIKFEQVLAALDQPFSDAASFQRSAIKAVVAYGNFSRLTTGGVHGNRTPALPTWLKTTPGQVAAREEYFVELAELDAELRERDAARVRAGKPARNHYPTKLFGSAWY